MTTPITHVCEHCQSPNVLQDAWARWNPDAQAWELHSTQDHTWCEACERETNPLEVPLHQGGGARVWPALGQRAC